MKKILITGSNGLLGQKITDAVIGDLDLEYIASSRGNNRHTEEKGYTYISLDITDHDQVRSTIMELRPDVIINTAAMANVDACEKDPEASHLINVAAVANLISICEAYPIHLIHLSTDFVFDGEEGPYKENDEPKPLSTYGRHKMEAEKLLEQSACNWSVVRTILVYGIVRDMSRSNIVLWVKNALENGQEIKVVNDQWRMPTLAEDLAKACLIIAKREEKGIFHISGKDLLSIDEMVAAVIAYYKLDASLIHKVSSASLQQDASRPKRTGFILDKAYERLDYLPHSFEEGLKIMDLQLKEIMDQGVSGV